jgi:hypothetical protein
MQEKPAAIAGGGGGTMRGKNGDCHGSENGGVGGGGNLK